MESNQGYTDEEIVEMLQDVYDEHGKVTPNLFNNADDTCSVSAVMRRFGDWSSAKDEAGIDDEDLNGGGRKRMYTDEQILSHLRELNKREGKATLQLLKEHDDLVGPTTVVERFDSWNNAKEEAGVE